MNDLYSISATRENVKKIRDAIGRAVESAHAIIERQAKLGAVMPMKISVPAKFSIGEHEAMVTFTLTAPERKPERFREIPSLRALNGSLASAGPSITTTESEEHADQS